MKNSPKIIQKQRKGTAQYEINNSNLTAQKAAEKLMKTEFSVQTNSGNFGTRNPQLFCTLLEGLKNAEKVSIHIFWSKKIWQRSWKTFSSKLVTSRMIEWSFSLLNNRMKSLLNFYGALIEQAENLSFGAEETSS